MVIQGVGVHPGIRKTASKMEEEEEEEGGGRKQAFQQQSESVLIW